MPQYLGDTMKSRRISSRQSGVSLVEVLVSIAIGLIVLTAIGTVYVNSNNSLKQREDQASLDEPARIIMRLLRQNLMQSGYVDILDLTTAGGPVAEILFDAKNTALTNMYVRDTDSGTVAIAAPISRLYDGLTPVFGCDGAMQNEPMTITTTAPPLVPACDTASATRHSLRIAYQGVPITAGVTTGSLSAANVNTGDGLDCLQQATAAGPLVINDFFVDGTGPLPQFACRGSGAAAAGNIAAGVEEFVLRYQMSGEGNIDNPTAAGGIQTSYISATGVSASAQGWAGVTAIEVCIVSATNDAANGAATQGTRQLQPTRPTCSRNALGVFNNNIARAAGDTRLWKRYTSVVSLRNSVFSTPL